MQFVHAFATEATLFKSWAETGNKQSGAAAREALTRIVTIYSAALQLPREYSTNTLANAAEEITSSECPDVSAAKSLPLDFYAEVDPLITYQTQEFSLGSLVDDIQDIYQDVVSGLRIYQAGSPHKAAQHWQISFQTHWGEHASSALRALHAWLTANNPEQLSASDSPPLP